MNSNKCSKFIRFFLNQFNDNKKSLAKLFQLISYYKISNKQS